MMPSDPIACTLIGNEHNLKNLGSCAESVRWRASLPELQWNRSGESSPPRSRFCILSSSGCYIDSTSSTESKRSWPKVASFADGDCGLPSRPDIAVNGPRGGWAFRREFGRPLSDLRGHALRGPIPDHCHRGGLDPDRKTGAAASRNSAGHSLLAPDPLYAPSTRQLLAHRFGFPFSLTLMRGVLGG